MLLSFLSRWIKSSGKSVSGFSTKQKQILFNIIGYRPTDLRYYELAFKHRSAPDNLDINNERLEFLGDAVLSIIISEKIYHEFTDENEGFLSELRSKLVKRTQLNDLANKLGCHQLMSADKALLDDPSASLSILGNALEALIGAIYIDKGFKRAQTFMLNVLENHIDIQKLSQTELNYKSRLLEWAQKNKRILKIIFTGEHNEGQTKMFAVEVLLDEEVISSAMDTNKKDAEQQASEIAFHKLDIDNSLIA